MDEVIYEELKEPVTVKASGSRNSAKRIFPAIDIERSGTRRDDNWCQVIIYQALGRCVD